MARLRVIAEQVPPGMITLSGLAARAGRSPGTIRDRWARRPGFPERVGRLAARGRHGGGRGELVYREAEVEVFLAAPVPLAGLGADVDLESRVTLGWFADNVAGVARKTVTQCRHHPTFPAGAAGRYRLGDLVDWWPTRPGRGARRR